jgi:hypothetical protein
MRIIQLGSLRRSGALVALLAAASAIGASAPLAASADGPSSGSSTPVINPCVTVLPIGLCPTEGPTVLEVGDTYNGDVPSDWNVAGYGYSAGDKYTVKIINVKTGKVLDKTTAVARDNGTITAQSPVYYIAPPEKGISLDSGWNVTHPLPLCGVTLQATLTDVSTGTSQKVITPVCPPPPPIK